MVYTSCESCAISARDSTYDINIGLSRIVAISTKYMECTA